MSEKTKVLVEVCPPPSNDWDVVGMIGPGDTMGSMADTAGVLLFGWHEGGPGVWRYRGGYEYVLGQLKGVKGGDIERISDLEEPYQQLVMPETGGMFQVRWSLV